MTDPHVDAMSIPCDPELLEPLGRVAWAAIRLHHGVRDAINHLNGAASDAPFDDPLGTAIKKLKRRAEIKAYDPDRTKLVTWCDVLGTPAAKQRNGVLHAISYTDADGRQALAGSTPDRPSRYLVPELLEVASQLVVASRALPPGPYGTV